MPRIRLPLAQNPTTPYPESDYPLPPTNATLTYPGLAGVMTRLKPPVGDQVFALEDVTRANMATIALEVVSVAETATSA